MNSWKHPSRGLTITIGSVVGALVLIGAVGAVVDKPDGSKVSATRPTTTAAPGTQEPAKTLAAPVTTPSTVAPTTTTAYAFPDDEVAPDALTSAPPIAASPAAASVAPACRAGDPLANVYHRDR